MKATSQPGKKKRLALWLPGVALLLVMLGLSALNTFNLVPRYQGSPVILLLFTALTVLLFLLLLLLLVLLSRNILKMYAHGQSRVLGSRLRSRMLLGALLLSFAPIVFMALFSFLLMNRSMDRWFSQPVARVRAQSLHVAQQMSDYTTTNARAEAESVASSPDFTAGYAANSLGAMTREMRRHRITLEGGFIFVYRDGVPVAGYQTPAAPPVPFVHTWQQTERPAMDAILPRAEDQQGTDGEGAALHARPAVAPFSSAQTMLAFASLRAAQDVDAPILSLSAGASQTPEGAQASGSDYAMGAAAFDGGGLVVVALPLPRGLGETMSHIAAGAQEYWAVYRERRTVRSTFLLLLTLVTVLTFFASTWLALFLSKQITQPVEALADAMDAIAAGDYQQRIAEPASDELNELIQSFNQMAGDLEESRRVADSSVAQIEGANRELTERQHELELILETIPSGVVVLDGARRVLRVNRAFLDLLTVGLPIYERIPNRGPDHSLSGETRLEELLPAAIVDEVLRLERRAQRMGVAGVELELPVRDARAASAAARELSLSVTFAVLSLGVDGTGHQRRGSVLVVDDVSEALQAQRQVAWKEVARRVAHEIKNPLTPIALSAERILRHLDRSVAESPAVIRRCSQVILSSVETMRLLVDQFGALAEFPRARPRPVSLNSIAEAALLLFQDRLNSIRVETRLAPGLALIEGDPEALKRAVANLIDNAAEAMSSSLHRVLRIETALAEGGHMAEMRITDTGPGLAPEVRERLFVPYFSTKERGTGLGLAIAAKIVQDHQGRIRAEQTGSYGATFVLDLPLARDVDVKEGVEV